MRRILRIFLLLVLVALSSGIGFMTGQQYERYQGFIVDRQMQPVTVEANLAASSPLTSAERLYGLALLWSEARQDYPLFHKLRGLDWDAAYQKMIPLALDAPDDLAYYRVLQEFAALLKDGHTRVSLPQNLQGGFGQPEIWLAALKHDLIVESSPGHEELKGGKLIAVDGQPVEQVAKQIQHYLSASTDQDLWNQTARMILEGPAGSTAVLSVQGLDGKIAEIRLERQVANPPANNKLLEVKGLGGGIHYARIYSFASADLVTQFNQEFPNFDGVNGLILDVRGNGGGNNSFGNAIISRLISLPVRREHWQTRQRTAYLDAVKIGEQWYSGPDWLLLAPNSLFNQYRGPVIVLTDSGTYSASENFVAIFKSSGRAILIGQKTGGSTGQPIFFDLPGGAKAAVLTKWDRYPDGSEFVGVGVTPDIEVWPTPQDIATGKDPVLDMAVELLSKE